MLALEKSRLVRELLARVEDDERFGFGVGPTHRLLAARRTTLRRTRCDNCAAAYGIAPKDSATATREKLAAGIAELGLSLSEGAELMPPLDHVFRAWRG